MRIDSHQHFWRLSRGDYAWPTPDLGDLYRDFEPADLAPHLLAAGVSATVLVQAAETDGETDFLLEAAARTPFVAGVVGWVDLTRPDAPDRIASLARNPWLKGLRPMLQNMADDDHIVSPAVAPALAAMVRHGLALDALIHPRHLPRMALLRQRFPDLAIVIDHAAKPDIPIRHDGLWARDLAAVAADGVTCCKLSGLVTQVGPGWTVAGLAPCVGTILDLFGPDRVMWGSDWPVLTTAATYAQWLAAAKALTTGQTDAGQEAIFAGTARRFYRLEV